MSRAWCLLLLAAACARGGQPAGDAAGDDQQCTDPVTYFADGDGDMHGDATRPMPACTQPPGTVMVGDDCDDRDANRAPGLTELCDGIDNDCDEATVEQCPATCQPVRRPPPDDQHVYLFCGANQNWPTASATCASAMFTLAQIDDAAENAFIRATATQLFGAQNINFGANDRAAEDRWVWEDGTQFWQGRSGGQAVGGRFVNWSGGEPNDDSGEDCGEMVGDGRWNDHECGDGRKFVCRR